MIQEFIKQIQDNCDYGIKIDKENYSDYYILSIYGTMYESKSFKLDLLNKKSFIHSIIYDMNNFKKDCDVGYFYVPIVNVLEKTIFNLESLLKIMYKEELEEKLPIKSLKSKLNKI